MKKYIMMLLSFLLCLLTLCGCNETETPSEQDDATPPDNYASIVLVTINPEIKLFLDADNNILAAEYLNDDARTAYSGLELTGKPLDDGLSELVVTAISKEYLKPDADITVEVSETTGDSQSEAQILSLSQEAITAVLSENSFSAHVVVVKSPDAPTAKETSSASAPVGTVPAPADTVPAPAETASASGKTCESCNGTGKCPECKGGTIPCPACAGSGYEQCTNCDESGIENCLICNGKGYEICPHCNGTGKIKCEICGGTHKWQCSHCHGAKTAMDCPKCNGSFNCSVCGGSGIIK